MAQSRVHDQIVDLITRAHTESDSMEVKIHALQQAMELMLYHTAGNERIDEFLETFLSMHVNRDAPVRRFCAYFIEMLCFTRSRYACSCLEVLVTLLQDSDKQVQIFALRAARVIYKRALYWISVQQREPVFVQAARESVEALDHVLARIVHLITSSSKEVFCESIRCAQLVVLIQSHSTFGAKSQAQLEAAGCSSLEDLKLVDTSALDESKLKGQSDRLFTALCALLVKKREESAPEMEIITIVHAIGIIGQQRSAYAGAATVAFSELSKEISKHSNLVKGALVSELKRILASRHCVQWQPQILPVLASLGIVESDRGSTSNAVLHAEMERLRQEAEAERGLDVVTPGAKRRRVNMSLDEEGDRLMTISELADAYKVPDENQAEAICAVRAQTPAELAKMALSLLGKLPKKFDDELMALVKVNRANVPAGGSLNFERRVKAAKAMDIRIADLVGPSTETPSDEEMELLVSEEDGEKERDKKQTPEENTPTDKANVAVGSMLDVANVAVFLKLISGLGIDKDEKLKLIGSFFEYHIPTNPKAVVDLFRVLFRDELLGEPQAVGSEEIGSVFVASCRDFAFAHVKNVITETPFVSCAVRDLIDAAVETSQDVQTRRAALTVLSTLVVSKPGIASDCLDRLLRHCSSDQESVRTDALKLLLAKVYRPQKGLLASQWPYSEKPSSGSLVESWQGKVSRLDFLCSEDLEIRARTLLATASETGQWNSAWTIVALCSKKPGLVHAVLSTLIDTLPEEATIPSSIMNAFGQTLISLPPEVIEPELELLVKQYKAVRSLQKKKVRNAFILPILSALSGTDRGLTGSLADAALSFGK